MDLTPGERAVLGQIRTLYAAEAQCDHQVKTLVMQWPPTQREAYQQAYERLLAKLLIQAIGGQHFRITEKGLRTMGIRPPKPQGAPKDLSANAKRPLGALSRLAQLFGKTA